MIEMSILSDKKGLVFDIQRFSLHDGPGIRTTVFLKGCPLKCKWCHNPESWENRFELFYHAKTCIGCGECVGACDSGAHLMNSGIHEINREKCIGCFKCADVCPTSALEVIGEEKSVSEVMATVLRDAEFYKSGGGVTVSGGEPFMQSEFLTELLKSAKNAGIHTCVETSGAARIEDMLVAKEYTDIFLFDCKMIPGEKHKEFIGSDGVTMHENLKALDKSGAKIILRCPIIPGVNDNGEHFEYISNLAKSLDNLIEINVQAYHATGIPKARDIGKNDIFEVLNFDAKIFKERIKNELIPLISSDLKVKLL